MEKDMEYFGKDQALQWGSIKENKDLTRSIDKRMAFYIGAGFILQVLVIPIAVAFVIKKILAGG